MSIIGLPTSHDKTRLLAKINHLRPIYFKMSSASKCQESIALANWFGPPTESHTPIALVGWSTTHTKTLYFRSTTNFGPSFSLRTI